MSTSRCTLALIAMCLIQDSTAENGWNVFVPPDVHALQGSSVIFNCSFQYPNHVSSLTDITAKWLEWPCGTTRELYNSKSENNSPEVSLIGNLTQKNCSLQISDVKTTHRNTYCFRFEIIDKYKWTGKPVLKLTVYDRPTKPIISCSTELVEGVTTTLNCSSSNVDGRVGANLNWYGLADQAAISHQAADSAATLTSNLEFIPSYQDHNKIVRCSVNYSNYPYSDEANITLQVKYAPKNITIQVGDGSQLEIKEDDKVSLTCTSNSYPDATYTWYKRDKAKGKPKLLNITRGALPFQNISRRDSGFYNCKATNYLGNETSEVLEIRVQCAPKNITIQIGDGSQLEIKEGDKVSLTCISNSYPDATYIWYKRDKAKGKPKLLNITRGALPFHNISRRDSGFYNCKATNYLGNEISENLEISVQYKPVEVKMNRTEMSFSCTAEANPLAQVTWNYTGSVKPVINGTWTSSTLTLQTTSSICVSCQAENKHGFIRSEKQCFNSTQISYLQLEIIGSVLGAVLLLAIVLWVGRKHLIRGKNPKCNSQEVLQNAVQDPQEANQTSCVYSNMCTIESPGEKWADRRMDSADAVVYDSIGFDNKPEGLKPATGNPEQTLYSGSQGIQVTESTDNADYENLDMYKTISEEAGASKNDSEETILYACIQFKDNPQVPKAAKHEAQQTVYGVVRK